MFPSLEFRRAYDAIREVQPSVRGDLEYLRILHLAASTLEADVQAALELLLTERRAITVDAVKGLASAGSRPEVPDLAPEHVDLRIYDALLSQVSA